MIRPWKVLSARWIFRDRWYRLLAESVDLGDGRTLDDYYLGVFDDVALVVAVTVGGEILFARQYKHGAQQILVELPGGYFDEGEAPIEAARRELREETGYGGAAWRALGAYHNNSTKERGGRIHLFLVTDARREAAPHFDPTEAIETLAVGVEEAFSPAFLAGITAAGTRLGLELARPILRESGLLP